MNRLCLVVAALLLGVSLFNFTASVLADEKLKDIACRSVHLGYQSEAGTAFYNEVTVHSSAPGTYFCAIGFNSGYFGIQELGNGKRLAIFSVWDPTAGDDPAAVPMEKRVKTLHKDDGVRVGRFGGEGTGGQSFFDFDWKNGETYRFLVTAAPDPADANRVAFSGYLFLPEAKQWKHLVTFSTLTDKKQLGGFYSFVEDFKRDRESTKKVRKAVFGNAWLKSSDGVWTAVPTARFTADSNPVLNIDAGLVDSQDRFWLATGGDTKNKTTKLNDRIMLPDDVKPTQPTDLPIE